MAINALANSYTQFAYGQTAPYMYNSPISSSIIGSQFGKGNTGKTNAAGSLSNLNSLYNLHGLIGLQNGTASQFVNPVNAVNPASAPFDLNQIYSNAQNDLNSLMRDLGYLVDDSAESGGAKDYLTAIKSASQQMQSALGSLMGTTGTSAFKALAPTSSDTAKLTVESTSGSAVTFPGVELSIDQVATKQVNQGLGLDAGLNLGGPALYEFSIEKGGKTYDFSITTNASDTNQSLQEKIAEAVNQKGIGLTATVEKDSVAGTSALKIEAKETGSVNQFVIHDVYGDAMGMNQADTVTKAAQDAIYRVNSGADTTSSSNTVDLGNGVKATLLAPTEEPVQISMQADGSGAVKALESFVQSYNDLITAAKGSDTEKSLKLNYQLASAVNTYAPSLRRAGIEMKADGTMSINKDTLATALKSGDLESVFGPTNGYVNYGFANRLSTIATEVNRNPMKYTDLSSLGRSNYYSDIYSPFQTTKYNQAYNTGLFLNMFV